MTLFQPSFGSYSVGRSKDTVAFYMAMQHASVSQRNSIFDFIDIYVAVSENKPQNPTAPESSSVFEIGARTLPISGGTELQGFQHAGMVYVHCWLDSTADLGLYGWIVAMYPLGQTIASFFFGLWSQKTKSSKYPVATGAALMGVGNFIYGTLPLYEHGAKWVMLAARFVVGFGSGNLSVLRAYVATASSPKDRVKALSLGIGMFVLGLSVGPAVMLIFTPLGADGFHLGWFPVTMYNLPALIMVLIAIIALALLFTSFQEQYAGIIKEKDSSSDVVVPKFDKTAAIICIGFWFISQCVATNYEALMNPLTMALYNWNNDQAILYNGIIIFASTAICFSIYLIIGLTRVGEFDKRKMIAFGLGTFTLYHLINIPWPFYSGPLDYMPLEENATVEDTSLHGGCFRRYEWCAHTTRVPLPLFIFAATVLTGISFPNIGSPTGTLFSEILGPRNQGFMQGLFAFFGSFGRFVGPIIST
uniref:MFS domain-containing protein n=1 Tax=Ascaris lumbricoides TaxID=6252 RepID=A0A0M3HSZ1_ASCLU